MTSSGVEAGAAASVGQGLDPDQANAETDNEDEEGDDGDSEFL